MKITLLVFFFSFHSANGWGGPASTYETKNQPPLPRHCLLPFLFAEPQLFFFFFRPSIGYFITFLLLLGYAGVTHILYLGILALCNLESTCYRRTQHLQLGNGVRNGVHTCSKIISHSSALLHGPVTLLHAEILRLS
ncbi:hypothetical protein ABW19_dt0206484 [Dactylella cylindrospora]|nr:hypothetical protein ABW19_dt0206484 [Dactylella cylindrospora]